MTSTTSSTLVPQLAAALPEFSADGLTATVKIRTGLKFADGTTLDAAAVKTSLDRHMTLEGSARRSELSSVARCRRGRSGHGDDPLKGPFTPLTAILADRAGMIMSPTALDRRGRAVRHEPGLRRAVQVLEPGRAGPHRGRQGTRTTTTRAKVFLDKVSYRIIADATTRFNNLRSGDVEVLDAVAATDVDALNADANLQLISSDSLGYQGITINLGNVSGVGQPAGDARSTRWPGRWPRMRECGGPSR